MKTTRTVAISMFAFLLLLAALSAGAQTTNTGSPPIPEEARKHFVMGTTLFKDAKTADELALVESEFKQATDLAPQWPDARLNLALTREAAGNYAGAMADLKLYQQFKLSETEARAVQDKLYALEAKQKKAAKEAESRAVAPPPKVKSPSIEGRWCYKESNPPPVGERIVEAFTLRRTSGDGLVAVAAQDSNYSDTAEIVEKSERHLKVRINRNATDFGTTSEYDLRLSEDGEKMLGTVCYRRFRGTKTLSTGSEDKVLFRK